LIEINLIDMRLMRINVVFNVDEYYQSLKVYSIEYVEMMNFTMFNVLNKLSRILLAYERPARCSFGTRFSKPCPSDI
jgi:hypothetical protein